MRYSRCGIAVGLMLLAFEAHAATAGRASYREEDVTFAQGSVTIACTLAVPAGSRRFPAVVLLSGSGPQNRDSDFLGFRPFRIIAGHLAEAGVAVLRCDDRGVGGSTGSILESTTEDFADDALAAMRMLAARADIRHDRIGLLGHSEGALAAALAAAKSPEVAFVVWMAGSAIPGDRILRQQAADLARAAGADAAALERIRDEHGRLLDAARAGASAEEITQTIRVLARAQLELLPEGQRRRMGDIDAAIEAMVAPQVAFMRSRWMRYFMSFDPATALARVACPVLALFGGRDMQVPPATNRPPLEAALGDNGRLTVHVYPEANHIFQAAVTGNPAEYPTLPKEFVPAFLDDLAAWIAAQ